MTVVILGFTFIIQSVAVFAAFSSAVQCLYQNILYGSALLLCEISKRIIAKVTDDDRKLVGYILSKNIGNSLWLLALLPSIAFSSIWNYHTLFISSIITQIGIEVSQIRVRENSDNKYAYFLIFFETLLIGSFSLHFKKDLKEYRNFFIITKCSIDAGFSGIKTLINSYNKDNSTSFKVISSQLLLNITKMSLWSFIDYQIVKEVYDMNSLLNNNYPIIVFWFVIMIQDLIILSKIIYTFYKHLLYEFQISLIFKKITKEELLNIDKDDNCPICLNSHNISTRKLPCSHLVHSVCISRMLQQSHAHSGVKCPVCRSKLNMIPPDPRLFNHNDTMINNHWSTAEGTVDFMNSLSHGAFAVTTRTRTLPVLRLEIQSFGSNGETTNVNVTNGPTNPNVSAESLAELHNRMRRVTIRRPTSTNNAHTNAMNAIANTAALTGILPPNFMNNNHNNTQQHQQQTIPLELLIAQALSVHIANQTAAQNQNQHQQQQQQQQQVHVHIQSVPQQSPLQQQRQETQRQETQRQQHQVHQVRQQQLQREVQTVISTQPAAVEIIEPNISEVNSVSLVADPMVTDNYEVIQPPIQRGRKRNRIQTQDIFETKRNRRQKTTKRSTNSETHN